METIECNLGSLPYTLIAYVLDGHRHDINAAQVVWSSSNPAVISLEPSADSKTAKATPIALGQCIVTATTYTSSQIPIQTTIGFNVSPREPVFVEIAVEPQSEPAEAEPLPAE